MPISHLVQHRLDQSGVVIMLIAPPILTVYFAFRIGMRWIDVLLFAGTYFVTGIGVAAGFHRMMVHQSFQPQIWLKRTLLICGQLAVQGPAFIWGWTHIKHHRFSDKEGDPHNAHRYSLAVLNFLWSHSGWLFAPRSKEEGRKYGQRLLKDRDVMWATGWFGRCLVASYLTPALIGGLYGAFSHQSWSWFWPEGFILGLVWGGLAPRCALHHVTWAINSVCHLWGARPYQTDDQSRDVRWLKVLSFGEAGHNTHHFYPRACVLDPRWWMDIAGHFILLMEKLGWVKDVKQLTPDLEEKMKKALQGNRLG